MDDVIHIAMTNSFKVIILGDDWEDLMSHNNNYLAHNPAKRLPNIKDLENILEYFIEQEDYRKCASLKKYIQENQIM
jgi:CRISPR/Cas system-associated protein Csm6|tara:strand:- start:38737 stop:38967 length:231 start_codon:yes stop_codon:yes gene_type:complete